MIDRSLVKAVVLVAGVASTLTIGCASTVQGRRHAHRQEAVAAAESVDSVYSKSDSDMEALSATSDGAFRNVAAYLKDATSEDEIDLGQAMVFQIRHALECRAFYDSADPATRQATRPCNTRRDYSHALVARQLAAIYGE